MIQPTDSTLNSAKSFFLSEALSHARKLSFCDSLLFLRGLVLSLGDTDDAAPIREAVMAMEGGDQQLQLIAAGQMTLDLRAPSTPTEATQS